MRMRAEPGKSWPRGHRGSGCSLVLAQIRMLVCCSHMPVDLFLRLIAMIVSCFTFLWPAAMATSSAAQSCRTWFSGQKQVQCMHGITKQVGIVAYFTSCLISSAISCRPLLAPTYGHKFGNQLTFQSQVNFSCVDGYRLIGSSSRTCLSTQLWSGQNATCSGKANIE